MRFLGLVITLDPDGRRAASAIAELTTNPAISVGAATFGRLPIVVESNSTSHERDLLRTIARLEGVLAVMVAYSQDDATVEAH